MALFNFNKAPAALFETRARRGETDEVESYPTAELAPLVVERFSVLQEESTTEGMSFSAKRGVAFSPLIFGDKDETSHVRAGVMGDAGLYIIILSLLALVGLAAAPYLGIAILIENLQHILLPVVIALIVGLSLLFADGGR